MTAPVCCPRSRLAAPHGIPWMQMLVLKSVNGWLTIGIASSHRSCVSISLLYIVCCFAQILCVFRKIVNHCIIVSIISIPSNAYYYY